MTSRGFCRSATVLVAASLLGLAAAPGRAAAESQERIEPVPVDISPLDPDHRLIQAADAVVWAGCPNGFTDYPTEQPFIGVCTHGQPYANPRAPENYSIVEVGGNEAGVGATNYGGHEDGVYVYVPVVDGEVVVGVGTTNCC